MSGSDLAAELARLSAELVPDFDDVPTLERVCQGVLSVIPVCDGASVTVRRKGGRFDTVAATSEVVRGWDEAQYLFGEGPCVDAADEHDVFRSPDLAGDARWPRWGPWAGAEGARSLVSVRLSKVPAVDVRWEQAWQSNDGYAGPAWGALNLYGCRPWAFNDDHYDLALVYATHAATALRASREVSGLQTALESRHQIGMAQGLLMAQHGLTPARAFEVLRRYASNTNQRLRHVAADLIADSRIRAATSRSDKGEDPGSNDS